jgi:hypothetical protein
VGRVPGGLLTDDSHHPVTLATHTSFTQRPLTLKNLTSLAPFAEVKANILANEQETLRYACISYLGKRIIIILLSKSPLILFVISPVLMKPLGELFSELQLLIYYHMLGIIP